MSEEAMIKKRGIPGDEEFGAIPDDELDEYSDEGDEEEDDLFEDDELDEDEDELDDDDEFEDDDFDGDGYEGGDDDLGNLKDDEN
jgi:hypothetical protein